MTALAAAFGLQLVVALVALLGMAGGGSWLLRALRLEIEGVERLFYAVCLGMAAWMFYPMLLGFAGLAYKPLLLLPLVGLLGLRELRLGRGEIARASFLLAVLLPLLFLTLYPPETADDLSFHLPIAQSLLAHHRLVIDPWLRFPVFTLNAEMLFVYGLMRSPTMAQVFPWLALVAIGWGCFAEGRRHGHGLSGGYMAFALLLGNQLLLALATICFVDVQLGLYLCAGVFAFERYLDGRDRRWLTLAATLLGVAAGIKYTVLVVVAIVVAFLLLRRVFRDGFHFGAILAVVACPWYLRNLMLTGNPVWPYLGNHFPVTPFWTPADYAYMLVTYKRYVTQTGWHGFLTLPWQLADTLAIPHHPITLWLWPGLALFVAIALWTRRRDSWPTLLAALAVILVCFFSFSVPRYDIPIVPLLAVLAARGYDACLHLVPSRALRYLGILAVFIVGLAGTGDYVRLRFAVEGRPPSSTRGVETYLSQHVVAYDATKLAASLPGRTYGLGVGDLYFYGHGKVIGDTFGPARYGDIVPLLTHPTQLHQHLAALDCRYLLIKREASAQGQQGTPEVLAGLEASDEFKKLYADQGAVLYALR